MLLQMGELTKIRVRKLRKNEVFNLPRNVDSLGVCFCPMDYRMFCAANYRRTASAPEKFFDETGNFVPYHEGYRLFYTIGQRRGLGII